MIINFNQLKEIRENNKDKKIVTCAGCFDLFHVGHLNYLKNGKRHGDILVVVVRDDYSLKKYKGENRPIIPENQRLEIIDNIKCVDYTIKMKKIYDCTTIDKKFNIGNVYQEQSLWERYIPIIDELKPDIIYTLESNLGYSSMKRKLEELDSEVIFSKPLEGISTTKIIEKKDLVTN